MEQMLTNLKEALEQVKEENLVSKSQKILERAIEQAVSLKKRWKTNWELQN